MIRSASRFSLFLILALLAAPCLRAENVAEVLDTTLPHKNPATVPGPTAKSDSAIPPVKVDRGGTVDEPDFKASVKVRGTPAPNYDPVSKSNNAIAVPISPWAVPEEDGHVAPINKLPTAPGDKVAVTTEDISPSLAALIAREKSGKVVDPIPELQAIISADPQNAAAHYRLGLAQIRANLPLKGLPEMETAIALQPRNPKYLCDYGIAALRAGWVEKAFAACQEAVNLSSQNGRYLSALGDVHLAAGHPTEATESYRRAIAADPKNPAYYFNLGLAYSRKREMKAAIEAYSEAIALKSNEPHFYCSRGLAFENLQNMKGAMEDYLTAIKIDKNCAYAHYLLAGVFSDPDDPTYTNQFQAIDHAEKAVKLTNYKNAQYLMGMARALRVARNYEQAADVAKKALELEPGRDDYRREWGVYERLKKNGFDR